MMEQVYLNLLRTSPRRAGTPGLDPLITTSSSPEALREALKLDEQHQALRLSDIWGRSQRVEHEDAEMRRKRQS